MTGTRTTVKRKVDGLTLRLRVFLAAWVVLIFFWSAVFMVTEGFSFVDALYFCVVTVTTVGYGDLHAQSAAGKVLAILLILSGVGTFGGLAASVTEMLLTRRERAMRAANLNMVIGVFFSEVGLTLLTYLSDFDERVEAIKKDLLVSGGWSSEEFDRVSERIRHYDYKVDAGRVDFEHLRGFLTGKRNFMLRLLENPSLIEHELFTDLLLAVFHLTEELGHRTKIKALPDTDQAHLAGDVQRIYILLVHQWLEYMRNLKTSYPYLFSLALRTNPFDEKASPVVTS